MQKRIGKKFFEIRMFLVYDLLDFSKLLSLTVASYLELESGLFIEINDKRILDSIAIIKKQFKEISFVMQKVDEIERCIPIS